MFESEMEIEGSIATFVRETRGNWDVLHVAGEVDLSNVRELEAELGRLGSSGSRHAALDLTRCTYLDSTGLHAIARAYQNRGKRLRIVVPEDGIRRVFKLTNLADTLGVVSRLDAPYAV